jgi:hypothetical protein
VNWSVVKEPTILMTAAVYGLLGFIAISAGIFGIWLGVLLLFSLWRYCYSVLRAVAQGQKRIPPPDIESFNPVGEWGVFWHFVLFPGLLLAIRLNLPGAFLPLALLAAFTFPASVALMGLTSNLAHALNPTAIVALARTLGSDYLSLVLGTVVILGGAFAFVPYIAALTGFLALLLSLVVEVWALLAVFAIVGAALRKHRLEFDIPGEFRPRGEDALELQHAEWHKTLDIAYASFRGGLDAAGYTTLHDLVDSAGDSLEVNHWLVENMFDWEDKKYALEVAAKLMPRLLAREDGAGALDLYRRCRRHDPDFRVAGPAAEKLAAYARSFGHAGLADELSYN